MSTHFHSYLRGGVDNVKNWRVAADNFNVLKKKFMFIPINIPRRGNASHWALAVVVNADCIDKGMMYATWSGYCDQFPKDYPAPCILYLDSGDKSYNQTNANKNCSVIKAWLESKMQSNHNDNDQNDNIRKKYTFKKGNVCSMNTIPVRVPLQENDIDCGPFVCAFASQMLKLLDYTFYFNES